MDGSNEGPSKATVDDLSIKKNEEVSQVAIPNAIAAVSINNIPGIKGIKVNTRQIEDNNQRKEIRPSRESSKKTDGISPIGKCIAFIIIFGIPVLALMMQFFGGVQKYSQSSKNVAYEQSSGNSYSGYEFDNEYFSIEFPSEPEVEHDDNLGYYSYTASSPKRAISLLVKAVDLSSFTMEQRESNVVDCLKGTLNGDTDTIKWLKEEGYLDEGITDNDIQTGWLLSGCPTAKVQLSNGNQYVTAAVVTSRNAYFFFDLRGLTQDSIDDMLSSFTIKQP